MTGMIIDAPIENIIVKERKRAPYSDILRMVDSISTLGLINPITITRDLILISGYHRLKACEFLGWETIPAIVHNSSEIKSEDRCEIQNDQHMIELKNELIEIDENLVRFELVALDLATHFARRKEIYEIFHPETKVGSTGGGVGGIGTKYKTDFAENANSVVPSFVEDTSTKTRKSKRTVYDYLQIAAGLTDETKETLLGTDFEDRKTDLLKLSKEDSETQKRLSEKLATGVAKSYHDAKRLISSEDVQKTPPIEGMFRVVYADPPWEYGGSMNETYGTADKHYPTMSLEDICNIPIQDHLEDNSVLFLWTTSPVLEESFQVINSWGFKYKSSFIWDKQKHVMGHYNSVRHEILLVSTRGSCTPENVKLFDSVVSEPRTDHSKKPEIFREIIDTIYPSGSRIELFARATSPGWESWGNQV
jgi:N6-adenosine-specific RNA methylase IME4